MCLEQECRDAHRCESSFWDQNVGSFGLEVALSDRIESVKAKIQKIEESLPSFKQLLLFAGQQLEDGNSLEQYGVEDNSVIFVVFKPTGIIYKSRLASYMVC